MAETTSAPVAPPPASPDESLRLGMVAGETSGDLLASLLLQGLKTRWPALQAAGIGGPRMNALGFDAWWPAEKLSIFGYVDALRHYRELVGIRNRLGDRLIGRASCRE